MKKLTGYVCLLALAGVVPAAAESIRGVVYDASGAVVPNALVRITKVDTNATQTLTSGADGAFQAMALAAGKYRVDYEARGFRAMHEYVTLAAGADARQAAVLPIGRIWESMKVSSQGTPAVQPAQRIRVGGNIAPAKLLKMTRVAYPASAKSRGAAGTVLLRAVILMDGTLGAINVLRSPDEELSTAAIDTVKQWRYQPTELNGAPVETETVIEIAFELTR